MTYTKVPKTSAVYTSEAKFDEAFILAEDGTCIMAEDNTFIVFISYLMNIFNKITKTVSSWTKEIKP